VHWFRNKDLRNFFIFFLFLTTAAAVLYAIFPKHVLAILLGYACAILLFEFIFARRRYMQISELYEYLKLINSGKYDLGMQDHTEGELSILKSEIYKTTVTLRAQADELKREKTGLSDAMSDISHQLKTPLTSMLVMTDLLCDNNLPSDKRKEFTDSIRAQLDRLQWLVTALLKLSRLDTGTISFNLTPVNMQELLSRVSAPLQIALEIREQKLIIDSPDITFSCDSNWTMEALLNIIKNCIEHTKSAGTIRVSCLQNALFTQIEISDNGEGISQIDLPHIFERFYRGRNASEDSVGIGLAMAKSIITSQDGSISVASVQGEGTTFQIRFFE